MDRIQREALAQLLDGGVATDGEVTDDVRGLAALATAMEAGAARPRAEFRADLRSALVAEARRQAVQPPALLTRLRVAVADAAARWRYSSRLAVASGAAALALSGGGTAVAADHALPGDLLYPVKLVLEDARILLVRDEASRGERHLANAARRVEEARASAEAGQDSGAARALREADASTRLGAGDLIAAYQETEDRDPLRTLLAFTLAQRERVEGFSELLGRDGGEAAADHLVTLDRIEARVSVLLGGCPACPDAAAPGVPPRTSTGFDFATIPPAHEEFDACPCPPADSPAPSPTPAPGPTPALPPAAPDEDEPDPQPSPDPGPADDPPPDEPPPGPLDPVLDPVLEPLPDEVTDPLEDLIKQLLDPTSLN